jgi:Outer membrane protein beta-barrel domain
MSPTAETPATVAPATSTPTGRSTARLAPASLASVALVTTLLAVTAGTAHAQASDEHSSARSRFEFIISSGGLLPTGDQRDALKRANMTLAQVSYAVRPYLAITSSMGWARSRDIATSNAPKLDVFTYDVGAELRADRWLSGRALTFTPFAGAGAGGRSYNYRSLDVDATHNLAAYGSAGGELGFRRIRFRVEARDYVTGFKPMTEGGASGRRNDVSVMAGFRITAH